VHAHEPRGYQALFSACFEAGHVDVVLLLLGLQGDRRVDVHANDDAAFGAACRGGNAQLVQVLLDLEGDRAVGRAVLGTAFTHACRKGFTDTMEVLLAVGGDRRVVPLHSDFLLACVMNSVCYNVRPLQLMLALDGDRTVDVRKHNDAALHTLADIIYQQGIADLLALPRHRVPSQAAQGQYVRACTAVCVARWTFSAATWWACPVHLDALHPDVRHGLLSAARRTLTRHRNEKWTGVSSVHYRGASGRRDMVLLRRAARNAHTAAQAMQ